MRRLPTRFVATVMLLALALACSNAEFLGSEPADRRGTATQHKPAPKVVTSSDQDDVKDDEGEGENGPASSTEGSSDVPPPRSDQVIVSDRNAPPVVRDPGKGFPSLDDKILYVPKAATVALPKAPDLLKSCSGGATVLTLALDPKESTWSATGIAEGKDLVTCVTSTNERHDLQVVVYDPKNPPIEVINLSTVGEESIPSMKPSDEDELDITILSDSHPILEKLAGTAVLADWLQSTPEGTHKIGGIPCPVGYEARGSIGECSGNGSVLCRGNLVFCSRTVALAPDPSLSVLVDLTMDAQNTHVVGGLPCPSGSVAVGGVPDCGAAWCQGNQNICAVRKTLAELGPGSTIITAFEITPENAHKLAPECSAGMEAIGSVADCGQAGGIDATITGCYGSQLFCVQRLRLE